MIIPADRVLDADLDDNDSDEASSLEKLLLGFTNSMTPNHPKPVITTAFRDHLTDDASEDLVREDRFFSPAEFSNADHYIFGQFDAFGQFRGAVSVYGERHEDYIVAWPGAKGTRRVAVPSRSIWRLFSPISERQPYRRRITHVYSRKLADSEGSTYTAMEYEFFHTATSIMTGSKWKNEEQMEQPIIISRIATFLVPSSCPKRTTPRSRKKPGREGFRENTAYRQLRDILKNFLVQVAGDFFREEGRTQTASSRREMN